MSLLERLETLPYFSASCLKVIQKSGDQTSGMGSLMYLPLQARIHAVASMQLAQRGEIRLVVVKPRQIRSSTYFMSLGYEELLGAPGTQELVITNKGSVTDELFRTVKRFHDHLPRDIWEKPKKDNDDELYLPNESLMKVATAGSDGARGFPCRMLVASEVGRYTNRQSKDYTEGALQTLAKGKDTIGIEESTSGGYGNYFHEKAVAGWDEKRNCTNRKERWWTIFYGYHEEPDYRLTPPKDWEPDDEEKTLAAIYGLTWSQLYWRYDKIKSEFRGSTSAFNREYPISFSSAFEDAAGKLYDSVALHLARANRIPCPESAGILGVDPAGGGNRTVAVERRSICVPKTWCTRESDDTATAMWIARIMDERRIHTCVIDMGYGHGIYSILRAMGRWNVVGIWGNAKPNNPMLYANKRTEMAAESKTWLHQGPDSKGGLVSLEDNDDFIDELRAIPDLEWSPSKGCFILPSKNEIKEQLALDESPDYFDAFTYTFGVSDVPLDQFARMDFAQVQPREVLETSKIFKQLQGQGEASNINPYFKHFSLGPGADKDKRQW